MRIRFGFIPSPPDHRDYIYGQLIGDKKSDLPEKYFRERIPINEQIIGDCVGQAARAIKVVQEGINYPGKNYDYAPDFIYSECKKRDGMADKEGTIPRIAMGVLKEIGACRKGYYPELNNGVKVLSAEDKAYEDAKNYLIGAYARVQTLDEIKQAIMEDGPVMAGLIITTNFVESEKGFVGLPKGYFLGGHAIALDGWDDQLEHTFEDGSKLKGFFRFINSWGDDWGDKGYGYLPYEFVQYTNDLGMKFFSEAWSSVDIIVPTNNTSEMILWIGKKEAIVNGKKITLDQAPVIDKKSNRTLVPLRFISENYNLDVLWDEKNQQITIKKKV